MSLYETVYILTNVIYIFTTDKLFEIFFDKKSCNLKIKNVAYIAYFIVLGITIFITRLPIVLLIINIIILFLISLTYKSSFQRKIFSISSIYAIGMIVEIISAAIFGFFELSGTKDSTFNSISALIFMRVVTLIFAYVINRYKNSLQQDYSLPKVYYFAYFIVLFGSLYLFTTALENENITMNHIIISGAVLIMVNITMIVIDEKIYNAIILENEKNLLEQQTIAYENQMELINQSSESIKLLKHDFKDHLIMLSNLHKDNKNDGFETYIDKILGSIEKETFAKSNNFVIDSILNFKLRGITNSDINLSLNINVPITVNILDYDLTIILANLLDNAITACEKSKEKGLDIKISCKMDNLIILISNSYNGKIIDECGKFKTTKLYKAGHGLGLTSVEKTINKYGGEMRISYTGNTFSSSVIIPY